MSEEQYQIYRDDVCERAFNFIESLTVEPLLLTDDAEMTIGDVQEHARIELKSLRSMSQRRLHSEIARLREDEFGSPECEANARLIAAAPDLLTVLKRIDSVMDFNGTCHPLFYGLQKQMQDAIDKAQGRS